jgi:dTDP-4-dehydrorhamnose reductase
MLRLAGERAEVSVVADQHGAPTSAFDIADGVISVGQNLLTKRKDPQLRGIFHMTGSGSGTWAEFASEIFRQSARYGGPSAQVRPITTTDYPTPAQRPTNSRLDCSKLATIHGVALPDWRASLEPCVKRLVDETKAQEIQR